MYVHPAFAAGGLQYSFRLAPRAAPSRTKLGAPECPAAAGTRRPGFCAGAGGGVACRAAVPPLEGPLCHPPARPFAYRSPATRNPAI